MLLATTLLAHQGGWDEALMFLAPVALFVLLWRAASTRAHQVHDPERPEPR